MSSKPYKSLNQCEQVDAQIKKYEKQRDSVCAKTPPNNHPYCVMPYNTAIGRLLNKKLEKGCKK